MDAYHRQMVSKLTSGISANETCLILTGYPATAALYQTTPPFLLKKKTGSLIQYRKSSLIMRIEFNN